ncbi:DUF3667 domain-containing protein [Altericroceibacterium endophyticum]|uniref:DUF3667 domain-containing protein n=1 Tax=Altericroceibacterium endophyticum TaxID=1808508 RepID=A0A6I4T2P7_9SPHN|nr:DUF3667 domain-containing protein [Altericroceibacterium endophyticum]MXO65126.1 DUF3667 domain-containing protein [Altericroceibacterium endophyticum]
MNDISDASGTPGAGAASTKADAPAAAPHDSNGEIGPDGHTHEHNCLNCGTQLIGSHCHACGQHAHVHKTLGAFWHDLLHGALHFEGKIWHTLPLLAWRPGQLTRRYIDGERARFVSPMALFLFAIFLIFAMFQVAGIAPPATLNATPGVVREFETARDTLEQRRDRARKELSALPANDSGRAKLQQQLAEAEAGLTAFDTTQPLITQDGRTGMGEWHSGWKRLDKGIHKAIHNPGLAMYKLQANSYKFSWLLIPLSLPFMWLLFFWKRRFGLYDHAIFVTYSLSFMSLLFVTLSILGLSGVSGYVLTIIGATAAFWHIGRQLRGTYALSHFSALWRLIMMCVFITIIVVIFVALLLLLGLL